MNIYKLYLKLTMKVFILILIDQARGWYSLEGLILKLKLQHFDHLMRQTDSLEKTLMLGKIEGKRRRG